MINEKELNLTQISPTKRDFYQIWTELLDVSKKLSERWDPTSTNETDPGIVLLKVLTACTDKLNYNIDKSVLELFMPSVTQEDSMRKLCDLLGYNMKYYQSATTDVTISYKGNLLNDDSKIYTFTVPKFTQIKNSSSDISYTTLKPCSFTVGKSQDTAIITANKVPCIEGSYQVCSTNDGELITIDHIDDNYRFYLPEAAIAENGIFVSNLTDDNYSDYWTKVDNLNTVLPGKTAWKFGFDSYRQMPYIQFPEDIATLIGDGLKIEYIRTSGISGNVSARTLSKVALTKEIEAEAKPSGGGNTVKISADDLIAVNTQATTNGANPETINAAYNNYKKIIGTFDTLVTCRDYMNKIYNLYNEETNVPIVSNVIVSDIRDDINRAHVLCSFNEYGITYIDKANTKASTKTGNSAEAGTKTETVTEEKAINNFELLLYPFKTIYGVNNSGEYINSFKIDKTVVDPLIKPGIEESKTISHELKTPENSEIACIKNYLKLNARITTTYKVNSIEEASILKNIYTNIYKNFNMRQMDFGEDIPYDLILSCIEEADERIKNVSLDEPIICTKFMLVDGNEYDCIDTSLDNDKTADVVKRAYNKLLLRNVLAGRVPLFKYNTDFKPGLNESLVEGSDFILPVDSTKKITSVGSQCTINTSGAKDVPITLAENEVIQFRAPNFITEITYPAFVHYHLVRAEGNKDKIIDKNTEYQLKETEKLYIMYTSESATESSTNVVNSIFYGPGAIIKPNFELRDSGKVNGAGASWTKVLKSDTVFINKNNNEKDKRDAGFGMLTLGSNEQIEIRKPAKVELKEAQTYIYWTLNKGSLTTDGKINFKLIKVDDNPDNNYYSYTLKDGEYFYYTDQNKLDLAFYGSGTELIFIGGDPSSYIPSISGGEEVTVETISNFGIDQIPWVLCNFNAKTYMILKEYQYVNLTAGDKLSSDLYDKNGNAISLNNSFVALDPDTNPEVKYTSAGTAGTLININVDKATWEARSKLELNVGPTKTQSLRKTDKVTDSVTLTLSDLSDKNATKSTSAFETSGATDAPKDTKDNEDNENTVPISPTDANTTIDLATSISCISIGDTFEVPEEFQKSFKVKQFKKGIFGRYNGDDLKEDLSASLNNFNNYWTKCSLKDFVEKDGTTITECKLNFIIPKNNYGLLFIYCTNGSSAATGKSGVYLKHDGTNKPVIFNNKGTGTEDTWWTGFEDTDNKCYLRYGINVIKLNEGTKATPDTTPGTDTTPSTGTDTTETPSTDTTETTDVTTEATDASTGTSGTTVNTNTSTPVAYSLNLGGYSEDTSDVVLIGQLDLVDDSSDDGIDLTRIPYIAVDAKSKSDTTLISKSEQILKDIRTIDPDYSFYYNCLMDNSTAIDFNNNLDEAEKENLLTPTIWYDYNNINNKFVITEISDTDMKKGITIARTSKR